MSATSEQPEQPEQRGTRDEQPPDAEAAGAASSPAADEGEHVGRHASETGPSTTGHDDAAASSHLATQTDRELLTGHVAGDPQAFGELVRRHRRLMWSVALRILRNPHDTQDAVQNALEAAFLHAGNYSGRGSVEAWLHRVVSNAALDIAMKAGPIVSLEDREDLERPAPDAASDLRLSLDAALMALPEDLRTAFFLVHMRGFSYREAGELMEHPQNTVASWVFRARRLIVEHLGDQLPPAPPPASSGE